MLTSPYSLRMLAVTRAYHLPSRRRLEDTIWLKSTAGKASEVEGSVMGLPVGGSEAQTPRRIPKRTATPLYPLVDQQSKKLPIPERSVSHSFVISESLAPDVLCLGASRKP